MLPINPSTNPILAQGYFWIGIVVLGYAAYILIKWAINKTKYKSEGSQEREQESKINEYIKATVKETLTELGFNQTLPLPDKALEGMEFYRGQIHLIQLLRSNERHLGQCHPINAITFGMAAEIPTQGSYLL